MEKEVTEWVWTTVDSDYVSAIYLSREEAVAAARKECALYDDVQIEIGTLCRPDPNRYLPTMDDLLEWMDKVAIKEDFPWYDDALFYIKKDRKAAEDAFFTAVENWISEWVAATAIWAEDLKK